MKNKLTKALSVFLIVLMMLTSVPMQAFTGIELPDWSQLKANAEAESALDDFIKETKEENEKFDIAEQLSDMKDEFLKTSNAASETISVEVKREESNSSELFGSSAVSSNENVDWSYDESTKTLTFSGQGAIADSSNTTSEWHVYSDKTEKVVINEGITKIGASAFVNFYCMKEIVLPNGLLEIGENAFNCCLNLKKVILPESVKKIGQYAFYFCVELEELYLPDTIEYIGYLALDYLLNLKSLKLPEGLKSAGLFVSNLYSLEEYVIPASLDNLTYDEDFWYMIATVGYYSFALEKIINYSKEYVGLPSAFYFDSIEHRDEFASIYKNYLLYSFLEYSGTSEYLVAYAEKVLADLAESINQFLESDYEIKDRETLGYYINEVFMYMELWVIPNEEALFNPYYFTVSCYEDSMQHEICNTVKMKHKIIGSDDFCDCLPMSGTIGESDISWSIDPEIKTLTFDGEGEMPEVEYDFDVANSCFFANYNEYIDNVTFAEGSNITYLTSWPFYGMHIKRFDIPASIKSFDIEGFVQYIFSVSEYNVAPEHPFLCSVDGVLYSVSEDKSAYGLILHPSDGAYAEFTVPEKVELINTYAFIRSKLDNLYIGANVKEIGGYFCGPEVKNVYIYAKDIDFNEETFSSFRGNIYCYADSTICEKAIEYGYVDRLCIIEEKEVESVEFNTNKTQYCFDEAFDFDSISIKVNFVDGSSVVRTRGYKVSGFRSDKIGKYTVDIDYVGYKYTYEITIAGPEATEIKIGENATVDLTDTNVMKYLCFTPETSGMYKIASLNKEYKYTYGYVYDSEMNLLYNAYNNSNYANFVIEAELEGGKTYYIGLKCTSSNYRGITKIGVSCLHDGDWIVDVPATCDKKGSRHCICKQCGEEITEEINVLGHYLEIVDTVPATCYEYGTDYMKCIRCNFTRQTTLNPEHKDDDGDCICDVCDKECKFNVELNETVTFDLETDSEKLDFEFKPEFTGYYYISMENANEDESNYAYFELCTSTGGYIASANCGDKFSVRLNKNDTYVGYVKGDTGVVELLFECCHQGTWTKITDATCSNQGLKSRTCSQCGHYEEVVVEKLSHTDDNRDGICDVCNKSASDINVGQIITVDCKSYNYNYVRFIPVNTGEHIVTVTGDKNLNTSCYIYDADMNQLTSDYSYDGEISVAYRFEKGKVYYIGVYLRESYDSKCNVTVEYACTHEDDALDGTCDLCGEPSIVATGICGEDLIWTLYGTVLVISGSGEMFDDEQSWSDYTVTKVIVEEGVENIGESVFEDNYALKEVILPSTVKTIGYCAFNYCTALESVRFSEGLERIETYAFCNAKFETLDLPKSLEYIGYGAFYNCNKLTGSVVINKNVSTISDDAFGYCKNITEFIVDENNKYFSNDENGVLFNKDKSVLIAYPSGSDAETYEIPSSVITISSHAFSYSAKIKSVTVADGSKLERIGSYAFYYCSNLTDFEFVESISYIDSFAFYNTGLSGDLVLGENVEYVYSYSFYNTYLDSITILNKECYVYYILGSYGSDTVIKGYSASTAEDMAEQYDYKFKSLDGLTVESISIIGLDRTRFYTEKDPLFETGFSALVTYSDGSTATKNYYSLDFDGVDNLHVGTNTITATYKGKQDSYDIECVDPVVLNVGDSFNLEGSTEQNNISIYKFTFSKSGYYWFESDSNTIVDKIEIFSELTGYSCYLNYGAYFEAGTTYYLRVTSSDEIPCKLRTPSVCNIGVTVTNSGNNKDYYIFKPTATSNYRIDNYDGYNIRVLDKKSTICSGYSSAYTVTLEAGKEYLIEVSGYTAFRISCSNHQENSTVLRESTCSRAGLIAYTCDVCGMYREVLIPRLAHTYGEWTTTQPTVVQQGKKVRTCSVCNYQDVVILDRIKVDWEEDENYGFVNFTIVDAQTLEPLSDSWIAVETEGGESTVFCSDSDGKVSAVLPVGFVTFTAGAVGKRSRTLKYNIVHEEFDAPLIGLSDKDLIDVKLTSKEMTYQEIIDAGINVSDPDNYHAVEYTVTFKYKGQDQSFTYYEYEDDIYYGKGGVPSLGDSKIYVTEKFLLIVHGEVSWLKQMFEVEMHVYNNSLTDTFENAVATLQLPDGLSLAGMVHGEQSLVKELGTVAGGDVTSCIWYVRGDEAGTYSISANLSGMLMPYSQEFSNTYVTETPIKVYAEDAIRLYARAPEKVECGKSYDITIGLENISDITLYNVSNIVKDMSQCVIRHYSDGRVEKEVYVEETLDTGVFASEFRPGDKLEITINSEIFFKSQVYKDCIFELVDIIIDAEKVKTDIENNFGIPGKHTLGEYTVRENATCTENGTKVAVCENCGKEETEIIPALGHDFETEFTIDVEPNCGNNGSKSRHCTRCDEKTDVTEIPANDTHDLGDWYEYSAATCAKYGENRRDCKNCSYYESETIDMIPHQLGESVSNNDGTHSKECKRDYCDYVETEFCDYDEWITTLPSTCVSAGEKQRICKVCGYAEIETLPLADHIPGDAATENYVAPTCEEDGSYESVVYCSVCSTELTRVTKVVEKLGHKWDDGVVSKEGTCIEKSTILYTCKNDASHTKTGLGSINPENHAGETYVEGYIAATCTEEGYTGDTYCSDCKVKIATGEIIKALNHDMSDYIANDDGTHTIRCKREGCDYSVSEACTYGEWVTVSNSTCKVAGIKERVCSVCGHKETQELELLEHVPVEKIQEATCTVNGYKFISCSVCKANLGFETITKLGHDMGEFVSNDNGTHTAECKRAGCDYTEDYDCDFGEWTTITESTCVVAGEKQRTCEVCGYVEKEALPLAEHIPGDAATENYVAPTCEEYGSYESVVYCSVCSTELTRVTKVVEKLGHKWDDGVVSKEGTCIEKSTILYTCKNDASHTKTELGSINPENHAGDTYIEGYVAATCTEEGYTGDTYCSDCKVKIATGEIIEALNHDMSDYIANDDGTHTMVCNRENCDYSVSGACTYGEWVTVSNSTCKVAGIKERVCSVCGHKETEELELLEHVPVEKIQAATCTVNGYKFISCSVCKANLGFETITKLGHDMGDFVSDNNGEHTAECKRNGCSYSQTESCDFGEWTIVSESTCVVAGEKQRTCEVCGYIESEALPLAEHIPGDAATENYVAATCEADGSYDSVVYCSVCSKELSRDAIVLKKLGHDWDNGTVIEEGTCIKEEVILYTCKNDASHKKTVIGEINNKNHAGKTYLEGYVAAGCETTGYSGDIYCSDCFAIIASGKEIAVLGHKYSDTWIVDVNATCTVAGSKSRHCVRCDSKSDITEIVALGHDMIEKTVVNEATCTQAGQERVDCSRCDYYIINEIAAIGHDYGEWYESREPSLLRPGLESRDCSRCDAQETRETERLQGEVAEDDNTGIIIEYTDDSYNGKKIDVIVEEDFTGSSYLTVFEEISSWNIKTYIDGSEVQPDAPVLVRIPLPAGYNEDEVGIYHINSVTGDCEPILDFDIIDGYVCFYAYSFSVYIVVDESSRKTEPEVPEDPTKDCNCKCHKTGIQAILWKILVFFYRIFRLSPVCACGVRHY